MFTNRLRHVGLLLAPALGLAACDSARDLTGDRPVITIINPTSAATYSTNLTGVRLGGTVANASFVHVANTTTGFGTEGFVNYVEGRGNWFADATGLAPGDNVIVATADADGRGSRTASDRIVVRRPLQPASLILNGADAASATSYWVDAQSYNTSHQIALYSDGTGRSTTGSALTQNAGPAVTWAIWLLATALDQRKQKDASWGSSARALRRLWRASKSATSLQNFPPRE